MFARRRLEVPVTVDLEQTPESLHAHAVPETEIFPGDIVLVHNPPSSVPFGGRLERQTTATVLRAGPLSRLWARLEGMMALTELYEVGFEKHSTRTEEHSP